MDGKRKFQRNDSERLEPALDKEVLPVRIRVRAIYPSILKYAGRVSGELYIWELSGQERIVEVLSEDVPFLIDKRIGGRGCCGATQDGNKLFEIVIEEAKNA